MGNKYEDKKEIIIFSVFQKDNPSFHNEDCHQVIKNVFDAENIGYKELIGYYKEEKEKSLLVLAEHEDKVKGLCKQFNQESYLYSDKNRDSYLISKYMIKSIGKLRSVPKDEAVTKDNYTYDPDRDMYWTTEK